MDRYNEYQTKQCTHTLPHCTHTRWWLVLGWVTTKEDHPRLRIACISYIWCVIKFYIALHYITPINTIFNVSHGLSEHAVVHWLEKVLFNVVCGLRSEVFIQIIVLFQPCFFFKQDSSVFVCDFQPQTPIKFQVFIVNNRLCYLFKFGLSFETFGSSGVMLSGAKG